MQKETWDPSILTLKKDVALRFKETCDLAFSTTPHLLTPYISRSLSTCMCALDRAGRDLDQPWQDRIPNFPYANSSTANVRFQQ